ncbi:unnamed protein product [Gongylonema pulchrum]|uniref:NCD2 domain-containing protein n=1 Tax=Gongylonema pulchrum TaxID=637853 RepID=A0A183E109_9BILA|nr:unnamed protein product [Gongylonema pulchrum]
MLVITRGTGSNSDALVLTEAQIGRLAQCSSRLIEQMPQLEQKLMQNKKKISRCVFTTLFAVFRKIDAVKQSEVNSDTPVLTEAQTGRLAQCSSRLIEQMTPLEVKLIQSKKII